MAQTEKKIQQHKIESVAKLKENLSATPDMIFTDFRGMTFPQMIDLRAKLGDKQASYRVVRNAFARIAMKELGMPDASAMLEGPTALAFLGKDPSPAAKIIFDFTKAAPLKVRGGVIDGRVYGSSEIEALSRLPGRLQLVAMLMSTMNAPLTNLMYAMKGVSSKLVRTLAAVAEQKGKEKAN